MKSILMLLFFLSLIGSAQAQEDRYFNSRASLTTHTKQVKVRHQRKHYAQRKHHHRVSVPAVTAYRGETYSPDPVQWVARRAARVAGEVLGGRPSGCPYRFCGCALAIKIFGKQVAGLNLAANWLRFPRAEAVPGMVAAKHGHVFQLQSHVAGLKWRVWDANSGHGRIRIHDRSISGFIIVNPHRMRISYETNQRANREIIII